MYLSNDNERAVQRFLGRFDAIFTLNQDLLLELYYDPTLYHLGRWNGTCCPGIEPLSVSGMNGGEIIRVERRVGVVGAIDPRLQPIYKLHGSVNWTDGTGTLFVVGGGKESYIRSKPILATYFEEFKRQIEQPDARLMIIG